MTDYRCLITDTGFREGAFLANLAHLLSIMERLKLRVNGEKVKIQAVFRLLNKNFFIPPITFQEKHFIEKGKMHTIFTVQQCDLERLNPQQAVDF